MTGKGDNEYHIKGGVQAGYSEMVTFSGDLESTPNWGTRKGKGPVSLSRD